MSLALDELIAKPTAMPKVQLFANRVVFTPAGVAATCAAFLAAKAPPDVTSAVSLSVQQRVQAWDNRIAAGELRPQAIPTTAASTNDSRCFLPGAGQHHTTSTAIGK